jgi:hypothetical protein
MKQKTTPATWVTPGAGKGNVIKLCKYKPDPARFRQFLHVTGEPLRRLEDWMGDAIVRLPEIRRSHTSVELAGVGPRFEPLQLMGASTICQRPARIEDADAPLNALIEFLRCGEVPPDIYADFLLRLEVTK